MTAPGATEPDLPATGQPAAGRPVASQPAAGRPAAGQEEPDPEPLPLPEVARTLSAVLDRVETVVVGKREPLSLVLAGILAGGHVLLEDYPGLAKTLAARCFAQTLGLSFRRLQFTPDLLPADVTGSYFYDQKRREFEFRAGPVFTNLLLADEINRTPPKTQAALLEAMQERQVSVEGRTFPLRAPFHVLATANPIEYEGTYPLPEAQLDRFLLRVSFGYPGREEEQDVLHRRMARGREEALLDPVVDGQTLRRAQRALEQVAVDQSITGYIVDLAAATREHRNVQVGASPRGSLALLLTARAWAVMAGRDYLTPEDVKTVAPAALAHRISLRPELWLRRVDPRDVVVEICEATPTPASDLLPVYPAPPDAGSPGGAGSPGAAADPDDPVYRYARGPRT